jgi:hypothetical protein
MLTASVVTVRRPRGSPWPDRGSRSFHCSAAGRGSAASNADARFRPDSQGYPCDADRPRRGGFESGNFE